MGWGLIIISRELGILGRRELYLAQAGAGGAGFFQTAVVDLVFGVRVRVGAGPG